MKIAYWAVERKSLCSTQRKLVPLPWRSLAVYDSAPGWGPPPGARWWRGAGLSRAPALSTAASPGPPQTPESLGSAWGETPLSPFKHAQCVKKKNSQVSNLENLTNSFTSHLHSRPIWDIPDTPNESKMEILAPFIFQYFSWSYLHQVRFLYGTLLPPK